MRRYLLTDRLQLETSEHMDQCRPVVHQPLGNQEEQRGEVNRQYERLAERIENVEDTLQEFSDLISQMNEQTEKRLQSLLATVHEWVAAFERTIGRMR